MREKLNCPNCGAPIRSNECEYCGTMFYDFTTLEIGKVGYIRINLYGVHHTVRAVPLFVETTIERGETLYASNEIVYQEEPNHKLSIEFEMLPDDRGVMAISRRIDE